MGRLHYVENGRRVGEVRKSAGTKLHAVDALSLSVCVLFRSPASAGRPSDLVMKQQCRTLSSEKTYTEMGNVKENDGSAYIPGSLIAR